MLSWVNCILIAVLILTRPGDLFNALVVHSPTYLFICQLHLRRSVTE